ESFIFLAIEFKSIPLVSNSSRRHFSMNLNPIITSSYSNSISSWLPSFPIHLVAIKKSFNSEFEEFKFSILSWSLNFDLPALKSIILSTVFLREFAHAEGLDQNKEKAFNNSILTFSGELFGKLNK